MALPSYEQPMSYPPTADVIRKIDRGGVELFCDNKGIVDVLLHRRAFWSRIGNEEKISNEA